MQPAVNVINGHRRVEHSGPRGRLGQVRRRLQLGCTGRIDYPGPDTEGLKITAPVRVVNPNHFEIELPSFATTARDLGHDQSSAGPPAHAGDRDGVGSRAAEDRCHQLEALSTRSRRCAGRTWGRPPQLLAPERPRQRPAERVHVGRPGLRADQDHVPLTPGALAVGAVVAGGGRRSRTRRTRSRTGAADGPHSPVLGAPGAELQRDAIRVTERHLVGVPSSLHMAVRDAKLIESRHPRLQLRPVGHRERTMAVRASARRGSNSGGSSSRCWVNASTVRDCGSKTAHAVIP